MSPLPRNSVIQRVLTPFPAANAEALDTYAWKSDMSVAEPYQWMLTISTMHFPAQATKNEDSHSRPSESPSPFVTDGDASSAWSWKGFIYFMNPLAASKAVRFACVPMSGSLKEKRCFDP